MNMTRPQNSPHVRRGMTPDGSPKLRRGGSAPSRPSGTRKGGKKRGGCGSCK